MKINWSPVLLDDEGVSVSDVSPPPIWPSVVEVVLSAQPARFGKWRNYRWCID